MWIMERKARPGDKRYLYTPTEKVSLARFGPNTRAWVRTGNAKNVLEKLHAFKVIEISEPEPEPVPVVEPVINVTSIGQIDGVTTGEITLEENQPGQFKIASVQSPFEVVSELPEPAILKVIDESVKIAIQAIKSGVLDNYLAQARTKEEARDRPRVTILRALMARLKTLGN